MLRAGTEQNKRPTHHGHQLGEALQRQAPRRAVAPRHHHQLPLVRHQRHGRVRRADQAPALVDEQRLNVFEIGFF